MPLYIGNTKISDIVLTDSNGTRRNISEARISNDSGTLSRAVFPDSVGAPIIDTFSIPASSNVAPQVGASGSTGFTVTGSEGATFELTASASHITFDARNEGVTTAVSTLTGTIPSGGTYSGRVIFATNPSTADTAYTMTIEATGISILSDSLTDSIQITQDGRTQGSASFRGDIELYLGTNGSPGSTLRLGTAAIFVFLGPNGREGTVTLDRNAGVNSAIGWRISGGGNGSGTISRTTPTTTSVTITGSNNTASRYGTAFVRTGTVTAVMTYDGVDIPGTSRSWTVTVN